MQRLGMYQAIHLTQAQAAVAVGAKAAQDAKRREEARKALEAQEAERRAKALAQQDAVKKEAAAKAAEKAASQASTALVLHYVACNGKCSWEPSSMPLSPGHHRKPCNKSGCLGGTRPPGACTVCSTVHGMLVA